MLSTIPFILHYYGKHRQKDNIAQDQQVDDKIINTQLDEIIKNSARIVYPNNTEYQHMYYTRAIRCCDNTIVKKIFANQYKNFFITKEQNHFYSAFISQYCKMNESLILLIQELNTTYTQCQNAITAKEKRNILCIFNENFFFENKLFYTFYHNLFNAYQHIQFSKKLFPKAKTKKLNNQEQLEVKFFLYSKDYNNKRNFMDFIFWNLKSEYLTETLCDDSLVNNACIEKITEKMIEHIKATLCFLVEHDRPF